MARTGGGGVRALVADLHAAVVGTAGAAARTALLSGAADLGERIAAEQPARLASAAMSTSASALAASSARAPRGASLLRGARARGVGSAHAHMHVHVQQQQQQHQQQQDVQQPVDAQVERVAEYLGEWAVDGASAPADACELLTLLRAVAPSAWRHARARASDDDDDSGNAVENVDDDDDEEDDDDDDEVQDAGARARAVDKEVRAWLEQRYELRRADLLDETAMLGRSGVSLAPKMGSLGADTPGAGLLDDERVEKIMWRAWLLLRRGRFAPALGLLEGNNLHWMSALLRGSGLGDPHAASDRVLAWKSAVRKVLDVELGTFVGAASRGVPSVSGGAGPSVADDVAATALTSRRAVLGLLSGHAGVLQLLRRSRVYCADWRDALWLDRFVCIETRDAGDWTEPVWNDLMQLTSGGTGHAQAVDHLLLAVLRDAYASAVPSASQRQARETARHVAELLARAMAPAGGSAPQQQQQPRLWSWVCAVALHVLLRVRPGVRSTADAELGQAVLQLAAGIVDAASSASFGGAAAAGEPPSLLAASARSATAAAPAPSRWRLVHAVVPAMLLVQLRPASQDDGALRALLDKLVQRATSDALGASSDSGADAAIDELRNDLVAFGPRVQRLLYCIAAEMCGRLSPLDDGDCARGDLLARWTSGHLALGEALRRVAARGRQPDDLQIRYLVGWATQQARDLETIRTPGALAGSVTRAGADADADATPPLLDALALLQHLLELEDKYARLTASKRAVAQFADDVLVAVDELHEAVLKCDGPVGRVHDAVLEACGCELRFVLQSAYLRWFARMYDVALRRTNDLQVSFRVAVDRVFRLFYDGASRYVVSEDLRLLWEAWRQPYAEYVIAGLSPS